MFSYNSGSIRRILLAVWTYKNIHINIISFTVVFLYSDYAFCLDKMKNKMTEPYSNKLTDYLTLQIHADKPHKKEQSQRESKPVSLRILIRVAITTVTPPLHLNGLQPSI